MPNDEGRIRARLAVTAELAHREWNAARLASHSKADPGTIGDFLAGKRWIKLPTQGKIERALEWPPGTISSIEAGGEPPAIGQPVGGDQQDEPGIGPIKARTPANMSDEDFKRLLNEYREEIEWKLDRAARERDE